MNSEVKELHNALVTIKGNALRCGNSIYSIHNIVSLTFDSVTKEKEPPVLLEIISFLRKFFCKYLLYSSILTLIYLTIKSVFNSIDPISIEKLPVIGDIIISNIKFTNEYSSVFFELFSYFFIAAFITGAIEENIKEKYNKNKLYYVYGLRIIFVNSDSLFFVSKTEHFVKDIIEKISIFISDNEYAKKEEIVINFSDRSVNIKEAVSSNIIGGSVHGDVKNG